MRREKSAIEAATKNIFHRNCDKEKTTKVYILVTHLDQQLRHERSAASAFSNRKVCVFLVVRVFLLISLFPNDKLWCFFFTENENISTTKIYEQLKTKDAISSAPCND